MIDENLHYTYHFQSTIANSDSDAGKKSIILKKPVLCDWKVFDWDII